MRVHNPGTVVQVFLPLTTYELSALRLLLQADIERTKRDNPHTGPGPDPRAWPAAMRSIAGHLDRTMNAEEAASALATHYLATETKNGSPTS